MLLGWPGQMRRATALTIAFSASSLWDRNGSVAGKDKANGRGQPEVCHATMLGTIGRNFGFRTKDSDSLVGFYMISRLKTSLLSLTIFTSTIGS
jgi:hypothetical protein